MNRVNVENTTLPYDDDDEWERKTIIRHELRVEVLNDEERRSKGEEKYFRQLFRVSHLNKHLYFLNWREDESIRTIELEKRGSKEQRTKVNNSGRE